MTRDKSDPEGLLPLRPSVFHILLALSDGDLHGYAIMQEVAEHTGGQIKLGPGTLYGAIKRLLSDRLIVEADERPDPELDDERRRYYRLTDFGQRVRKHEVSSILIFGYALDALVTAGVAGNLVVFLLVKITRFNPLRIALWTFLIVNAVPAVVLAIMSSRLSPASRPGATVIGYAVSFVFWLGIHWMWAQWQNGERLAPSNGQ